MDAARASPSPLGLARDPENLTRLQEANTLLDRVQKGLQAWLEGRRLAFRRFFFLSDDEVLDVMMAWSDESQDATRAQPPHLAKCFAGIASLV